MDRRRRQYVPLSVMFAHGQTGTKIVEKLGRDGLLVWVCLLAAAKRSPNQGVVEIPEGSEWSVLGLAGDPPDQPLETFLREFGRMRQTSLRRSGRVLNVTLTRFGEWNKEILREQDAEKKRRKRGENTGDDAGDDTREETPPLQGTEGEGEKEGEGEVTRVMTERVLTALKEAGGNFLRIPPQRIERAIAAYPDRNHVAVAYELVNWEERQPEPTKDPAARYVNFLKRAEPMKQTIEPDYPLLQPGETF